MMSHRGAEFVMTIPRSGCGEVGFAVVRRDRTGEGGFVLEGGARLKRIFFTEMIRPMSYLVLSFASEWGNGS